VEQESLDNILKEFEDVKNKFYELELEMTKKITRFDVMYHHLEQQRKILADNADTYFKLSLRSLTELDTMKNKLQKDRENRL
jgi:hypothetical protein